MLSLAGKQFSGATSGQLHWLGDSSRPAADARERLLSGRLHSDEPAKLQRLYKDDCVGDEHARERDTAA
jgi:hypothetical protein